MTRSRCSTFATTKKNNAPPWHSPRFPARTTLRTTRGGAIRCIAKESAPRADRSQAPREAREEPRTSSQDHGGEPPLARLPRIPVPRRPGLFAPAHGDRRRPDARTDRASQGTAIRLPNHVAGEEPHAGARRSTAFAPRAAEARISAPGMPGVRFARSSSKTRASRISGIGTAEANRESRIEPVHMHLEHRISQRLLGRFLSQGFMYHDLSRACLAQTKGSLPLVYSARAALPLRPSSHATCTRT